MKQENKAARDGEQCVKVSSSDGGWFARSVDPHSSSASNTLSLFDSRECSSGCLVNRRSSKSRKQRIIPFLGCRIELHYTYASKGSTWRCANVDHAISNRLSLGTIVCGRVYRCVSNCTLSSVFVFHSWWQQRMSLSVVPPEQHLVPAYRSH